MSNKLRYGQVGGTTGAFIGEVHRTAIRLDDMATLSAGCFSASHPDANAECGERNGIPADRLYSDYREMAKKEGARTTDKIDFVVICTPNSTHYEIALAFMEQGIHIVCEKPLCFTSEEAKELKRIAEEKHLLFCVTYTYVGYTMVKLARRLIAAGAIGKIIDIKGEYIQDWLLDKVDGTKAETNGSLSVWRLNPKHSGIACCVGDIGTHIEQVVYFVTRLRPKRLCAVLDTYAHPLDLNANILVEFEGGIHGTFMCSQVAAGHYNGPVIRIFGTEGAIEWEQEDPDYLRFTPKGEPTRVLARTAHGLKHTTPIGSSPKEYAKTLPYADTFRLPCGHPEGLTVAFANIYRAFAGALMALKKGESIDRPEFDFPTVDDGLAGMEFVEACVKSSKNNNSWVTL